MQFTSYGEVKKNEVEFANQPRMNSQNPKNRSQSHQRVLAMNSLGNFPKKPFQIQSGNINNMQLPPSHNKYMRPNGGLVDNSTNLEFKTKYSDLTAGAKASLTLSEQYEARLLSKYLNPP